MKNLILSAALLSTLGNAYANAFIDVSTKGPVVSTSKFHACINSYEDVHCDPVSYGLPMVFFTSALSIVLKQDIVQIEPDIHNFLAGEEMTLALEEQMNKIRESSEEAAALSDEELALAMIQIANM